MNQRFRHGQSGTAKSASNPRADCLRKNDPFFPQPGARACLRDLPKGGLRLLDTGHFALEEGELQIAAHSAVPGKASLS